MSSYFTNRSRHRTSYERVTLMNGIWRDIRHAVRSLRKTPGFLAIVILTLGLGIGANAAIFSLTDQILLRPLAVHDPSSLVLLDGPGAFLGRTMNAMTFSYPMYRDLRDRNEVFTGVIGRFPLALTAVWRGASERANGDLVSGNYFDVLGVQPVLGRLFNASDDRTPGAHPIAVLSYGYWQRKFGGDPLVLNQTITVNGHPLTIVGVSDRRFTGIQIGSSVDIMVPIMMKAQMTPTWNDLDNRRSRWLNVMARLKPGVTRTQAEAAMNVVYRQINEQEIKDVPGGSESFRKRCAAGSEGALGPSQPVFDAAHRSDVNGRCRAADFLRQRGQPAPRTRHGATKGDSTPLSAGCESRPNCPTAVRRERSPRARRDHRWSRIGVVDRSNADPSASGRSCRSDALSGSGSSSDDVCARGGAADCFDIWDCSRSSGHANDGHVGTEGGLWQCLRRRTAGATSS
jgi:MacB-like periplasmic core domain